MSDDVFTGSIIKVRDGEGVGQFSLRADELFPPQPFISPPPGAPIVYPRRMEGNEPIGVMPEARRQEPGADGLSVYQLAEGVLLLATKKGGLVLDQDLRLALAINKDAYHSESIKFERGKYSEVLDTFGNGAQSDIHYKDGQLHEIDLSGMGKTTKVELAEDGSASINGIAATDFDFQLTPQSQTHFAFDEAHRLTKIAYTGPDSEDFTMFKAGFPAGSYGTDLKTRVGSGAAYNADGSVKSMSFLAPEGNSYVYFDAGRIVGSRQDPASGRRM